ncbi:hypothetical protein OCT51_01155 [Halomonas sp. LR3S48]|uniref:hypothetical protein n=1 Tax=Halomonas sp. LR3S48 TaxID=2982694 RepID=UPI0021E37F72|nr:hypothetical protein [Halomonas sp. LR3S48]UYG03998.1 hypothetical protein OCT51_01155 [Halomonas sp. LR3S48]
MRYKEINPGDEDQVLSALASVHDDSTVMNAVLSAVYCCSTAFAGETLLRCLMSARGQHRIGLMRVVHTFMQMHRTDFLADSYVAEMKKYDEALAPHQLEIEDLVEGVLEFQEMYKGNSPSVQ